MVRGVRLGLFLSLVSVSALMWGAAWAFAGTLRGPEGSEPPVEYAFTDADLSIELPAGKQFTLTLPSNPTTGYGWQLAEPVDESLLRLVGSEYVPLPTRGVPVTGSGGHEVWSFESVAGGKTAISMKYVRPWERDVAPIRALLFDVTVVAAEPGSTEEGVVPPEVASVTFSLDQVEQLRVAAIKARTDATKYPDGWSKSTVDPAGVLSVFDSLRLKDGYSLIAYQYIAGGNGNGFVWAVPQDSGFPDPQTLVPDDYGLSRIPRPEGALAVMEAVEGDGTPWSYLSASILGREMREFGARWHGISWGTQRVLDGDPLDLAASKTDGGYPGPTLDPSKWTWNEPRPAEWKPQVIVEKDRVLVVFYTFTSFRDQQIERHTDVYGPGGYRFETKDETIAIGPAGFVF